MMLLFNITNKLCNLHAKIPENLEFQRGLFVNSKLIFSISITTTRFSLMFRRICVDQDKIHLSDANAISINLYAK